MSGDRMAQRMEVRPISRMEYERLWPKLSLFSSKTLFHEPCWLDYLESIGKGSARFLSIGRLGEEPEAYHVFLKVRLGPLLIMGSPLPGWTTNYMGPLFRQGADLSALLSALLKYLRRHWYSYGEFKNENLDPEVMRSLGFQHKVDMTTVLDLSGDPEDVWHGFTGNARNRIRKAESSGLVCEKIEHRDFIGEYYAMITKRYDDQGLSFPFSINRLMKLWDCLAPAGRLLVLRVSHAGETVAGGLFPFDENCIYYFGGASRSEFNHLCPNELMHYSVIRYACSQNIAAYDLCGISRFKSKFGGRQIPFVSYGYSPIPGLMRLRTLIHQLHWKRLQWQHALQALRRKPRSSEMER